MIIRHKVVSHQPKIKADHTGTVSFGTMLEVTKDQFDELNDAYYNKDELYLFVVSEDNLVDFVKGLAEDLTGQ
jgi:hypothetical protein